MTICVLTEVLTVAEISHIWGVNESTVWYHMNKGHFRWRDTRGRLALVERQSVIEYWGDIPCELSVYEKQKSSRHR